MLLKEAKNKYNSQIEEIRGIYNTDSTGPLKEELKCSKDVCTQLRKEVELLKTQNAEF
jgi:hypothetical protein